MQTPQPQQSPLPSNEVGTTTKGGDFDNASVA
jgi:hypothetical protein